MPSFSFESEEREERLNELFLNQERRRFLKKRQLREEKKARRKVKVKEIWTPVFPESDEETPEIITTSFSLSLANATPILTRQDKDEELEDSAAFLIGGSTLYFRCNWKVWCTIFIPSDDYIEKIEQMNYIVLRTVLDGMSNERDCIVPVYALNDMPTYLFPA